MIKKIITLFLVLMLTALVLAGCGKQEPTAASGQTSTENTEGSSQTDQDTQVVTQEISEVDQVDENIEDDELNQDISDAGAALSNW